MTKTKDQSSSWVSTLRKKHRNCCKISCAAKVNSMLVFLLYFIIMLNRVSLLFLASSCELRVAFQKTLLQVLNVWVDRKSWFRSSNMGWVPYLLSALAFPGVESQSLRTACKQATVFKSRATQASSFSWKHDSPWFPLHERDSVATVLDSETGWTWRKKTSLSVGSSSSRLWGFGHVIFPGLGKGTMPLMMEL